MKQDPEEIRGSSWCHRIWKRESHDFQKFVRHTKIDGLHHIVFGKSKLRRLIWLLIFLAVLGWCLYAIIKLIILLASKPTATTISLQTEQNMIFPAVTVCNLNPINQMYLEEKNVSSDFICSVMFADRQNCTLSMENATEDFDFYTLLHDGIQPARELFLDCQFQGDPCTHEDFLLTVTRLGFCYTFNSGMNDTKVQRINGSGTSHGLELVLNISQDNYIGSRRQDAGVKIAIHQQRVPGEPDDIGIGVPPGKNAFISISERVIIDESSDRMCQDNTATYNILQEEYSYSIPACALDCYFRNIYQSCNCTEPNITIMTSRDLELNRTCGREDSCCVGEQFYTNQDCTQTCAQPCNYTVYRISTSYSTFPSAPASESAALEFQLKTLGRKLGFDPADFNLSYLQNNLVAVSIYFDDLIVERETTRNSYTIVSLLADIGGQLGLFIGAGILPIIELCIWIFDEIKHRCCGACNYKQKSNASNPAVDVVLKGLGDDGNQRTDDENFS